jgi:hypothetical protein
MTKGRKSLNPQAGMSLSLLCRDGGLPRADSATGPPMADVGQRLDSSLEYRSPAAFETEPGAKAAERCFRFPGAHQVTLGRTMVAL